MPFGIDLSKLPFVPKADRLAGGVNLLCTRTLNSPVYDIPTLLNALAKARNQGSPATLTLAATGELAPSLKELAAQLGIERAVTFGDGYALADLPALMARHDVYVSASLSDGASVSLMEAMACGAFPLVSDIPANREWLVDGRNAALVRPRRPRRLGAVDPLPLGAAGVSWSRPCYPTGNSPRRRPTGPRTCGRCWIGWPQRPECPDVPCHFPG